MPQWTLDPTFYPSPKMAMESPLETLAYSAILDPTRQRPDALAVVDLNPSSKGNSRAHSSHCGPNGIYINALEPLSGEGPVGIFMSDAETFDLRGSFACVLATIMVIATAWGFQAGMPMLGYIVGWSIVAGAFMQVSAGFCIPWFIARIFCGKVVCG